MIPTFLGQAVLGAAANCTATAWTGTAAQEDTELGLSSGTTAYSAAPGVLVTGVLTGTSSGAVTTAKSALTALANAPGPLVVPTGRSAVPGGGGVQLTAAAAAGATSLSVASTAGFVAGQLIQLQSVGQPGIWGQVNVTAITSATALAVSATPFALLAGDLVASGPLQPYATLFPAGAATALPGLETYPGWDTFAACYFGPNDVTFGSTTGSGSAYQCTYAAIFRRALPGAN